MNPALIKNKLAASVRFVILIAVGIIALSSSQSLEAQTVNIVTSLDSIDGVTINQPAELTSRLQRKEKAAVTGSANSTAVSAKSGYRVEVYADNNRAAKTEAASRRARVQSRFPQYRVYQVFEAPFWRVKLGDFRSRNEATDVMNEIRRAFPSYSPFLRVVRDHIN